MLFFVPELATFTLQAKVDMFGPDSEQLVDVLLLMAEAYRALANYDEAETFLSQVCARSCSRFTLFFNFKYSFSYYHPCCYLNLCRR